MTITEEFGQLLEDLGLGNFHADGSAGGAIFMLSMPDKPDGAIAVARYAGPESDSRLPHDEPSIQIRVRAGAADARTAERTAQAVYDALHGLSYRHLAGGSLLILALGKQGGPIYIGRDQLGRHEWTVNLRTELRRPTAHRP